MHGGAIDGFEKSWGSGGGEAGGVVKGEAVVRELNVLDAWEPVRGVCMCMGARATSSRRELKLDEEEPDREWDFRG
jgi:hypothetical protein